MGKKRKAKANGAASTTLPELMKVTEVAEYFRVTPSAIYQRIVRGTMPYTSVGRNLYIMRDDVARELQRNRREVRRYRPDA